MYIWVVGARRFPDSEFSYGEYWSEQFTMVSVYRPCSLYLLQVAEWQKWWTLRQWTGQDPLGVKLRGARANRQRVNFIPHPAGPLAQSPAPFDGRPSRGGQSASRPVAQGEQEAGHAVARRGYGEKIEPGASGHIVHKIRKRWLEIQIRYTCSNVCGRPKQPSSRLPRHDADRSSQPLSNSPAGRASGLQGSLAGGAFSNSYYSCYYYW